MKTVILIDGKNYSYRHAFTRTGLSSQGRPTGLLHGGMMGLMRLHRLFPGAHFVFCWDGEGREKSWRHKLEASYKINRVGKDPSPERIALYQQIPTLRTMLDLLGFKQYEVKSLEADDLIGVMATHLSQKADRIIIYSTDKDMFQLISKKIMVVRDTDKKANGRHVTDKWMMQTYGVKQKDWLKFRCITGDASDHIQRPVPGVGPARAKALLAKGLNPTSKDGCIEEMQAHWENIRLCYRLSRIVRKADDKNLPPDVRKELQKIVAKIDGVDALRRESNKKNYRRFLDLLADYELDEVMNGRHVLWGI